MKSKTKYLHRLLAMILCIFMVFFTCDNAIITLVQALNPAAETAQQGETREEIKARLLDQIIYDGWDPYSADMSIDEFFALMELFDDGTLPINQVSTYAAINSVAVNEASSGIPRTKFLFAGLSNYVWNSSSEDDDPPLPYDDQNGSNDDYPAGLDPYNLGYMLPPETWNGIGISDATTNRVVLVSEGTNDGNNAVAGNVIQDLFAQYTGYYVKQVTIDGANINILGMIELGDRCVYYYLSAEGQSTQVSTTTLPDEAKFIIEYVPSEHTIGYKVVLEDKDVTKDVTEEMPTDVVFYGSNSPTENSWVDGIFGASRPNRTTDGAYSFDVHVPYGYELRILISIEMSPSIPYTRVTKNNSFHVEIDHTSSKQAVYDAWLDAYSAYLNDENFINDDIREHIIISGDIAKGETITMTWKDDDEDKPAHDSVLERMAERINDFVLHNNGYPLGSYPKYTYPNNKGFKIIPDEEKGPTEHTMNDTFYNHLVKADRTITAVLKKQPEPTFDVSQILTNSDGAAGRGASAKEDFAFDSLEKYDADYEYHKANGTDVGGEDDPLNHSAVYPNIQNVNGSWNWTSEDSSFRGSAQQMREDEDGTYYYSWLFQTNSGSENNYLDVFEVNGIAVQVPYYPKYNWSNYNINGVYEVADDAHPYFTEIKLADGATLRLEFLLGWPGGQTMQRHYRVTVTGARSNVVVTGLNIMQYGTGSDEFATYSLTGVYSDLEGQSQTAPAIEYYSKKVEWVRKAQSNVVVYDGNDALDLSTGDTEHHGANLRFKITDGYGSPYYIWANRHGDPIFEQTSLKADDNGNLTIANPVIPLKGVADLKPGEPGALENGMLSSQYIYDGGDGYYYIRVTSQYENGGTSGTHYKIALLTVNARTVKYTVRYTPEYSSDEATWHGFVLNKDGELKPFTDEAFQLVPDSMPIFKHNPEICDLWEMAENENGEVPEEYSDILHQYDDNDGPFYDLIFNNKATIANNSYGTIRPRDKSQKYTFVNWVLVDEDFMPVKDSQDKPIQFLGGAIDLNEYARYAVKHVAFGNASTDIHVLRLMPVWRELSNPFNYNVVLNWVDTLGNIHAEDFSDYWDEVVTEMTVGEKVFVFLNKDAEPLLDWVANHPTYTFWDDVNNATDVEDIKDALDDYLKGEKTKYDNIFDALTQKNFTDINGVEQVGNNTFERLGRDIFSVIEDGKICIWMYENKGGLIFHKDVMEEPFEADDEFYFTVTDALGGEKFDKPISGKYKAYPQFVYDDDGNRRDLTNDDAWLVEFENGKIVSIDGDESVTYFTLKSGDGVALYVPDGRYTIAELGSKSGGAYKAKVTYTAADGSMVPDDEWDIPDDDKLWLRGKSTKYIDNTQNKDVSQVCATVNFEIGEHNVVQTLTFCNQTSSLAIEKEVRGTYDGTTEFEFEVKLKLPEDVTPLSNGGEHYFNYNLYNVDYSKDVDGVLSSVEVGRILLNELDGDNDFNWKGTVKLKAGQRLIIVMTVPDADDDIHYSVKERADENSEYQPAVEDETVSGSISAGEMAIVKITNISNIRLTGDLTVENKIEGEDSSDLEFTFTVTLDEALNKQYGDMTFEDGVAKFTLKAGESKTAIGLPEGVGYTITETPAAKYTTKDITTKAAWITAAGKKSPVNKIATDVSAKTATGSIANNEHHTVTYINVPVSVLPGTGGIGTVILYMLGGAMTILAMVYLILASKKYKRVDTNR